MKSTTEIENQLTTPARCGACGAAIDASWNYCPQCSGAVSRVEAHGSDDGERSTTVPQTEFYPLPGLQELTESTSRHRRRRKRRRRRFYRRSRFVVPALIFLLVFLVAMAGLYRASSVMTSLHAVSTLPPEITDATFMDDDDPALTGGPITVDTGPAQNALADASDRDLPEPQESGIGGRLNSLRSDVGDVVSAASMAVGAGDGGSVGFTMLFMGVDARPGAAIDFGVRPDVLMLVRFDAEQRSCRMLSIPRDTRVELPGYGKTKINHALMVGGIPYQLMVTEDFIGQPIDHYMLIDFVAFRDIVDVLGGVDVTIPHDLEKHGKLRYRAGTYSFDGEDALAYARFRTFDDDGDLSRVERQWSILASMANAAGGRDLVSDVNTLVPTMEEHLRTDLTLSEMTEIARDYGPGCLRADEDAVAKIEGARVKFADPILNKVDYYNAVARDTVTERVNELLGVSATAGESPPSSNGVLIEVADMLGTGIRRLLST